jgi:hypothetical protein
MAQTDSFRRADPAGACRRAISLRWKAFHYTPWNIYALAINPYGKWLPMLPQVQGRDVKNWPRNRPGFFGCFRRLDAKAAL